MRYAETILELIQTGDSHYTAEDLFRQMKQQYPGVALATVYNNLNHLCEKGKIRKVTVEGHPDRYDRIARHDHLVCRQCGDLTDIYLEDYTEQLQSQISETILSYDLQIRYICPACRKNKSTKT